jgi:hypothetical protein
MDLNASPGRRLAPTTKDPIEPAPRLSVCVPTFRRPALVQRAIRSVIESASGHDGQIEIVVSDNSPEISRDACIAALGGWCGPSTYLGNDDDIGPTANFNQCIDRARGRYVLFVCDDDRLLPGSIPIILEAIRTADGDQVLLFGVDALDEDGRVVRRRGFRSDMRLSPRASLQRLLSDSAFVWFPGVVASRAAYRAAGPFEAHVGNAADVDMWARLFADHGVRCLPATISAYSVHSGSITQSMSIDGDAVARLLTVFERAEATGILTPAEIRRCRNRYLHQFILGGVYLSLQAGDLAGARRTMGLFDRPRSRGLGPSAAWLPLRAVFWVLARCPPAFVESVMHVVDRLGLVRLARGQVFGRRALRRV